MTGGHRERVVCAFLKAVLLDLIIVEEITRLLKVKLKGGNK